MRICNKCVATLFLGVRGSGAEGPSWLRLRRLFVIVRGQAVPCRLP
jgi:hypothetical protein